VQGPGLEIPCRVEIFMSLTVKNKELIEIYRNYVDLLRQRRDTLENTTPPFQN